MVVKRLAAPLVLACLLTACGTTRVTPAAERPLAAAPQEVTPPRPTMRTGPLGEKGAAASCVEGYTAKTVGNRAFAFDGTITNIGPGATNKAGTGAVDTAAVTFQVNEWFKGATTPTVTVDVMSPTNDIAGNEAPAYEQGTRLLVSGEPRWGGEPLTDAIAWSCGGFTRYYETAVADEWRQATRIDPVRSTLLRAADAAAHDNRGTAKRVEVAMTTRGQAADLTGHSNLNQSEAVWVVQVSGEHYVCGGCPRPPGASAPEGDYITLVLRASDYQRTDFGVGPLKTDLTALGDVQVLRDDG